ncbi:siderophore-interacting protein [Microvirga terrae]|uniref:Siderophore-interacting protein n=1 Tax=Microvirga terrae TaxID=2740529 RepID=A0ABY5RY31_9HYPH|nr:siderophore-interacting protein [Microvirga terrae]UVF21722.1 siderophore-interacting protein [Microvirga terrae]
MTTSTTLRAKASVTLARPVRMMDKLCEHFVEHGRVDRSAHSARVEFEYGTALVEARDDALYLLAEGPDATGLAYVKWSLAEHIIGFVEGESPRIAWEGDGQAGTPLPYFREMHVVNATNVTPRMRRVRLKGRDLARFATGGMHVRLLFPPSSGRAPSWPVMGEDGRPVGPRGEDRPVMRIYTIREIDVERNEIEIDFVLHEGDNTPGSTWALQARPGDTIGIMGPGGGELPAADWYLFAGDETALPAISRILAELPSECRATVLLEVEDASEEQPLCSRAALDIRWMHRNGAPAGTTSLIEDAVRAIDVPSDERRRFIWAGCEQKSCRCLKRLLRQEWKIPTTEHQVVAYWRAGHSADQVEH